MNVYADASLLVAVLSSDLLNERADRFLASFRPTIRISDFASAEFASAIARRARTGALSQVAARLIFSNFDAWTAGRGPRLETVTADVARAEMLIRRLDLALRTPDALNIAIAERHRLAVATFDAQMATAARALGLEVVDA